MFAWMNHLLAHYSMDLRLRYVPLHRFHCHPEHGSLAFAKNGEAACSKCRSFPFISEHFLKLFVRCVIDTPSFVVQGGACPGCSAAIVGRGGSCPSGDGHSGAFGVPALGAVGRRGARVARQVALPTLFLPVVCAGEALPSREPASLHQWHPGFTGDLVVRGGRSLHLFPSQAFPFPGCSPCYDS
jgi:hypothetical protein